MNVKLLFFLDRVLISQVKAIIPEEIGGSDLVLVEPFVVEKSVKGLLTEGTEELKITNGFNLVPLYIEYTTQNKFEIHSDKLVTMAEPSPQLLNLYENAVR
jgi:hypothetical protein